MKLGRPGPAGVFTAPKGRGHPGVEGGGRADPQDHPGAALMPGMLWEGQSLASWSPICPGSLSS
jgi:hypothetical protein